MLAVADMRLKEATMPPFGRRLAERGRADRAKGRVPATISFAGGQQQKCYVWSSPLTGALFEVTSILGIPDAFQLRLSGNEVRTAAVVRRSPGRVTVKFRQ
jgi:hypothetical protein